MDLSAVSFYDNIKTPDSLLKSCIYTKLEGLLNLNMDFEIRIFCPLCVSIFSSKFSLFEHLRTFHSRFLTQTGNHILKFNECPFCHAKFYGKHLTVKHVLRHHSNVIKELFVNKNKLNCFFCYMKLDKESDNSILIHIEEFHFFDFEEEFGKMFSCDVTEAMSMSELINSTLDDKNLESAKWEDVCMKVGKHSGNYLNDKCLDEASRINCFDFTDLKEQLEKLENLKDIKDVINSDVNLTNKSILKDIKNSSIPKRKARRVLRFDVSFENEHKENSLPEKNYFFCDKINSDECNLLCDDNKGSLFLRSNDKFEPQHSSTPNSKSPKNIVHYKSKYKSYTCNKKVAEFEFQCGKCRLLFKENLELVSHVKNNHKKFSLNALQPCYHCAICNAKFYKNYYLRKHHNLHKPY